MTLDAPLAAATALHRTRGADLGCRTSDQVFQLQLAHVLLDGGYDGVATLEEALAGGDLGLGAADRLDGELVIVDGEPWRVDWTGAAELLSRDARTPFVVVSCLESAREVRLRDCSRDAMQAAVEDLADSPDSVLSVRLEGTFDQVLLRSVKPQVPPYRPLDVVCQTDEVRWERKPFHGVFVGFRFPSLDPEATIAGLHLHGLDHLRTTGGHNYELHVRDARLSVGVSREVNLHLPDKSMLDLLEAPRGMFEAQRALLRAGTMTAQALAVALGVDLADATARIDWLADRGFAQEHVSSAGEPAWTASMSARHHQHSERMQDILEQLD